MASATPVTVGMAVRTMSPMTMMASFLSSLQSADFFASLVVVWGSRYRTWIRQANAGSFAVAVVHRVWSGSKSTASVQTALVMIFRALPFVMFLKSSHTTQPALPSPHPLQAPPTLPRATAPAPIMTSQATECGWAPLRAWSTLMTPYIRGTCEYLQPLTTNSLTMPFLLAISQPRSRRHSPSYVLECVTRQRIPAMENKNPFSTYATPASLTQVQRPLGCDNHGCDRIGLRPKIMIFLFGKCSLPGVSSIRYQVLVNSSRIASRLPTSLT